MFSRTSVMTPNGRSISDGVSSFSYMYTFDTINHLFEVRNAYISFWRNAVISLFVLRPLYKKDDCVFCGQETIKWFSYNQFSTPALSLNKILVRLVWFVCVLQRVFFRNNLKTHVRLRCLRKKDLIYPYFETLFKIALHRFCRFTSHVLYNSLQKSAWDFLGVNFWSRDFFGFCWKP